DFVLNRRAFFLQTRAGIFHLLLHFVLTLLHARQVLEDKTQVDDSDARGRARGRPLGLQIRGDENRQQHGHDRGPYEGGFHVRSSLLMAWSSLTLSLSCPQDSTANRPLGRPAQGQFEAVFCREAENW